MCATYNLAYPIVEHCRTLSLKKTRGLIIFYLTTIVTMIDNFINYVRNIQSCISYCRPLSNIVVLKNKGLGTF